MTQLERFLPWILIGLVFLVYSSTLYPTIAGGDNAELTAVAYTLGIAHPPGYPLFTLLGKLFTLLFPFGEIAWRLNLLSAIFGASAALFIFLCVQAWSSCPWSGLAAALLFSFSPLVWQYHTQTEVFALNNLLLSVCCWAFVKYWQQKNSMHLFVLSAAFALAMCNHHTAILIAGPLVLLSATQATPKNLTLSAAIFILGLTPYAYLFWSGQHSTEVAWGNLHNLDGVLHHVLRRDYGTFRLGKAFVDDRELPVLAGNGAYIFSLFIQSAIVGVVLFALGIRRSFKPVNDILARVFLSCWLLYILVFHTLAKVPADSTNSREVFSRFWQAPNLVVFILAGAGLSYLFSMIPNKQVRLMLVAALAVLQITLNYQQRDQSQNRVFVEFARAILETAPEKALILSRGDHVFNSLRYVHLTEKLRPDLVILDWETLWYDWGNKRADGIKLPEGTYRPMEFPEEGHYNIHHLITDNINERPILLLNPNSDPSWKAGYHQLPYGFGFLITEKARKDWNLEEAKTSLKGLPSLDLAKWAKHPPGSWEDLVLRQAWDGFFRTGLEYLTLGMQGNPARQAMTELSIIAFNRVADTHPNPPAVVFKNLGVAYREKSQWLPETKKLQVQAWEKYLSLAPLGDEHRENIARDLAALKTELASGASRP